MLKFHLPAADSIYMSESQRIVELETKVAKMQPLVDIALAVSDADLSVYTDVPDAHDLMHELDLQVDVYRGKRTPDGTHIHG